MTTKVIFRKLDGEIIALFPELVGDYSPYTCTCYAHIGQHSIAIAEPLGIPATPAEYADLLAELESIGYDDLKVIRRFNSAHLKARREVLKELSIMNHGRKL